MKTIRHIALILALMGIFTAGANAQAVLKWTIAAGAVDTGSTTTQGRYYVSHTIGEVFTASKDTLGRFLASGYNHNSAITYYKEYTSDAFSVKAYPNPVVENVYIEVNSEKEVLPRIEMYDVNGALVMKEQMYQNKFELNLDGLAQNTYFIVVVSDKEKFAKTFTIQKLE